MSLEIQTKCSSSNLSDVDHNNSANNNTNDNGNNQSSSSSLSLSSSLSSSQRTQTSSNEYIDHSTNDLTIKTGAALIVADCMGTGILALPNDINITLGKKFGLFFLFINVIINLYAGTILCNVASLVEKRFCGNGNGDGNNNHGSGGDNDNSNDDADADAGHSSDNNLDSNEWNYDTNENDASTTNNNTNTNAQKEEQDESQQRMQQQQQRYQRYQTSTILLNKEHDEFDDEFDDEYDNMEQLKKPISSNESHGNKKQNKNNHNQEAAHTFDFIGMTSALFDNHDNTNANGNGDEKPSLSSSSAITAKDTTNTKNCNNNNTKSKSTHKATTIVTIIYYTNIFLVLGNYILVMSHAVAAMIGEHNICLPNAGLIASTLMFGLCQLRSMSSLGRIVSFVSLFALGVVVVQCLYSIQLGHDAYSYYENEVESENNDYENNDNDKNGSGNSNGSGGRLLQEEAAEAMTATYSMLMIQSILRQFAALASIGFAVGSQKLLLNIRHEFKDRTQAAPQSLSIALGSFGTVYALVCILAGPNPPSFLFDAISPGNGRRIAGFLLWIHVAVSFAINSQALCSSIDRIKFHRITIFSLHKYHRLRWATITFFVSVTSFLIANAVPFFKDLVSLIGALTSVPLTLLLPALYYRQIRGLPLCCWNMSTSVSTHRNGVGSSAGNSSSLRQQNDIWSFLLVAFSIIFLIFGVVGSLSSIEIDWSHHGPPFACH